MMKQNQLPDSIPAWLTPGQLCRREWSDFHVLRASWLHLQVTFHVQHCLRTAASLKKEKTTTYLRLRFIVL